MKFWIVLLSTYLLLASAFAQASKSALSNLTEWHVDAVNGNDISGTGTATRPFESIHALLAVNDEFPDFVNNGDTIFLASGKYNSKPTVIDIAGIKIKGSSNKNGISTSILGALEITADEVALSNCLFLNSGLTLRGARGVSISDNFFAGTTKNSLTLLGSSNNTVSGNYFESATKSCVVLLCDSKSKQFSSENVFQANYFTHHPEKGTDQIIFINKNSLGRNLFSKKKELSGGNRFINCVFKETTIGSLKQVIAGYNSWKTVDTFGYSLMFEDCYFKKADRRVPFLSFVIINEPPKSQWFWDELGNDTWITSNKHYGLTGHRKNGYTPSIRFVDSNENGLILETEYPEGVKRYDSELLFEQNNRSPMIVNAVADIAVYQNAEPNVIDLYDVFEDTATADKDLEFTVNCDNPSLVESNLENGLLTLNYAENAIGVAQITITAIDNDNDNPKSAENPFLVIIVQEVEIPLSERSDWYVDSKKGNDESGTGSRSKPFKTIKKLLTLYTEHPEINGSESTVHLGKGNYYLNEMELNTPGLTVEGTLDKNGSPLSVLDDTVIAANGVTVKNCNFLDAGLKLLNVRDVLVSNNLFSGTTQISLSLLGSSRNIIQHNKFESAEYDCVHIYWDPESGESSNDNIFLRNYFTHRSKGVTNRIIRVNWTAGNNESISARNRFVECAFKETKKGQLLRVVDDDCTWWMVADHKYSVAFEDCYFKRADRAHPFSEFVILKGHPDFTWRWDELTNDQWVSENKQWSITGDHSGWNHRPRIIFVDKNGNDKALEIVYNAGLLPVDAVRQ